MSENEKHPESDFGYMDELSRAYEAAFAKRLKKNELSNEKRELLFKMQTELISVAEEVREKEGSEERKELALMLFESARECARLYGEESAGINEKKEGVPRAVLLARAVLLCNRSLNLLLRHEDGKEKGVLLILSELSALYALAAIN